eukprot:832831-Prorocentrum_minimum.AAC.3
MVAPARGTRRAALTSRRCDVNNDYKQMIELAADLRRLGVPVASGYPRWEDVDGGQELGRPKSAAHRDAKSA